MLLREIGHTLMCSHILRTNSLVFVVIVISDDLFQFRLTVNWITHFGGGAATYGGTILPKRVFYIFLFPTIRVNKFNQITVFRPLRSNIINVLGSAFRSNFFGLAIKIMLKVLISPYAIDLHVLFHRGC